MKRLFEMEVARFLSRRAVRVFGVLLILAVIVAGSLTFAFSNRDVDGARARAATEAAAGYEECLRHTGDAKDCVVHPDDLLVDPRFHLTSLRDVFGGAGVAMVMLGLALGASFIGAEWHHRTLTTLLTWESRRIRVLAMKLAASAAVAFAAVIAFQAMLGAALVPAAAFRGSTEGATAAWLGGVIGIGFRVATLAAIGAVLGGAIAAVTRNTAIALGISFAWLAVVEGIIRGLRPRWQPWLIGDNATAFVAPADASVVRTILGGGVVLAIYVLLVALIAGRVFQQRDVA